MSDLKTRIDFAIDDVAGAVFYHMTDFGNKETLKKALKQFAEVLRDESPIKEDGEAELWVEVELLAGEKRFIESNGPYCPEGFNVWHFIIELKSKFRITLKQ